MRYNKIAFTGTHSTGKSTMVGLLKEFSEFKGFEFIVDVSRKQLTEGVNLNKESNFNGQVSFMGHRAKELLNESFLCDRSIYDVMAYSLASKHITKADKKILENVFKKLYVQYDLILYVPIEFDLTKDGVRPEDEEYRLQIRNLIEDLLTKYPPKRILHVTGNIDQRLNKILDEVLE